MAKNKYQFGFEADLASNNININDFKIDYDQGDQEIKYNPYGKDRIQQINTPKTERITSIPSPYARMHVTDLAFAELRNGQTLYTIQQTVGTNDISPDYSRALSHCLDVYEMLFHSDEIDLLEKGITVQRIKIAKSCDEYTDKLNNYLETLQLFRDQYMENVREKMNRNNMQREDFLFDFSMIYLFKYHGKTFAATSPFTGFYAKSDCDLKKAGIKIADGSGNERTLFTDISSDWRDMRGRSMEFRKFMYLLLCEHGTKLRYIFNNLYDVVEQSLPQNELDNLATIRFSDKQEYRKFNVGNQTLQVIGRYKERPLYIRPDNLDSSYLKYLLFLAKPADLSISVKDYSTNLEHRTFNGQNGVYWLGPNDILSDALFVLPYDICDDYLSVAYRDETKDNQEKKRCLIPVKSSGLKHLSNLLGDFSALRDSISIVRKSSNAFLVKMKIDLTDGGSCVIRREYNLSLPEKNSYPHGRVIMGDETSPFAFGIYPFVKTTLFDNLYKVLFYHHDLKPITITKEEDGVKKVSPLPLLHFFSVQQNEDGLFQQEELPYEGEGTMVQSNQTVKENDQLQGNCLYYHIEAKRNGVDFIEVSSTYGTSLIIPQMRRVEREQGVGQIQMKNDEVIIAVDLGTSNTYAAYLTRKSNGGEFGDIHEISTIHTDGKGREWAELMFLHGKCTSKDALEENRTDLYLKNEDGKYNNSWLATQLCEFAPSRIIPQGGIDGYSFPIPSVINQTYVNGEAPNGDEEKIPLFNSAIPFAYYKIGKRDGDYDRITDGKFKWLRYRDAKGNYIPNPTRVTAFRSFVKELLFLFRSNLICLGYNPQNTTLIWTYPLSFAEELRLQHERIWKEEFDKCFHGKAILYTNESMAPIYGCISNPNDVDRLTLLIDIGGGSTDVYGFKKNQPKFSTSFSFAGNSLYLDGDLNHDETNNKTNVMRKQIETPDCKEMLSSKSKIPGTVKINQGGRISSIMNYGFSQAPETFGDLFQQNDDPKFLLKFHNAAIVYHVAQLCKLMSPNECPVNIYLTGNGSKLMALNSDYKNYIKLIFKHLYDGLFNEEDFGIVPQENPKTATTIGALVGYRKKMSNDQGLVFGVEEDIKQVVMLGDGITKFDVEEGKNSVSVNIDEEKKTLVAENVIKFVDFFYNTLWHDANESFKKEKINGYVKNATESGKMNFGGKLSESLFFQYISLIMENISAEMYKKYGL